MRIVYHLVVALAIALLTWFVGWWGVAVVALVAGVAYRAQGGRAGFVALAAVEASAALLLFDLVAGPLRPLSVLLQGVMRIPAPALLIGTLLFPAVIAWSAATVGAELARLAWRR